MCRWLAYNGGVIPLSELIFNTRHSLIDQSLGAELGPTTTNGDGFGVGWFDSMNTSGMYKNTQPAWNDANLRELCDHTRSHLFMAHIRASTGTPVQYTNCHPFRSGRWLFVHNGLIRGFPSLRRRLQNELNEDYWQQIWGGTDSELMFLLAMQFGMATEPRQGVERMAGLIESAGREAGVEFPLQMTLGISDGERLHAVRYSSEGKSRSLFHSAALDTLEAHLDPRQADLLEQMGTQARAVVSEPLSDLKGLWNPVPEASFITIENGRESIEPFVPTAP